ncbi:hypothetical protein FDECE_13027 [Fusarium decemcellulare]|nr:hypothetical protein FDECE_13027 [Fusarium decemcellulare]
MVTVPPSRTTARVYIIDTTFEANVPTEHFMGPPIKGFDSLQLVAYSFLIVHRDHMGNERKIIFDLGSPKDIEADLPPAVAQMIQGSGGNVAVGKYVSDILIEHGVSLESIEAIIWSHAHPDHVGRPSLFPTSTSLIVGPGLKKAYYPGYPVVESSPVLAREFEGRTVCELDLVKFDLELCGLRVMDYFGDGSFYFLSAPGHAVGHLNALVRTTEDTFMYLAADSVHHGSVLRPHPGTPLPSLVMLPGLCCGGEAFDDIHPMSDRSRIPEHYRAAFGEPGDRPSEVPFQTLSETPTGHSLHQNTQEGRRTVSAIQCFDSDPNILVVAAHDSSLRTILDYYPKEANNWREKGWKEKSHWLFLLDLKGAL